MNIDINKKVLLLGTGQMARQYYKAFNKLGLEASVIGNSEKSVEEFNLELQANAKAGSIQGNEEILIKTNFDIAFITVNENQIRTCLEQLSKYSIRTYIVEKPGAISFDDLNEIIKSVIQNSKSQYHIAYNRRFYQSVRKLKELVQEDGGAVSATFDFTELSDRILSLNFPHERTDNWFFLNSTHVIDLAFFLIGSPKVMSSMNFGPKAWHNSGDFFAGFGESTLGIPFSYSANWNAPGRWSVEVLTKEYRYYLKPMEKLERQKRNEFVNVEIPLNKPEGIKEGIFELVQSALLGNFDDFVSFEDQLAKVPFYKTMMNGGTISL